MATQSRTRGCGGCFGLLLLLMAGPKSIIKSLLELGESGSDTTTARYPLSGRRVAQRLADVLRTDPPRSWTTDVRLGRLFTAGVGQVRAGNRAKAIISGQCRGAFAEDGGVGRQLRTVNRSVVRLTICR